MKKQITLLSGLLLVTSAFGQVKSNIPLMAAKKNFALHTGKMVPSNATSVEKAEGDILWSNNFSNATNWVASAVNGTTGPNFGWQIGTAPNQITTWAFNNTGTFTGAGGYAGCENGDPTAGTEDTDAEWILMYDSIFNFAGQTDLRFQFQEYGALFNEKQVVEVSIDGGTNWVAIGNNDDLGSYTQGGGSAFANPTNRTYSVNTAFPGGLSNNMKFRFRVHWPETPFGIMYGWFVDNVKFQAGYANDLLIKETYAFTGAVGAQYTKFPAVQVNPTAVIDFAAVATNFGSNAQDVVLTATGPNSYNEDGTPLSIAGLQNDSVFVNQGYTIPTTLGTGTFTYTVSSDNHTLSNTTDDSKTFGFEVTNGVMAVDRFTNVASISGSFTGWGNQTGDPAIGTIIEVFNTADALSMKIGIANITGATAQADYVDNIFYGQVHKWNSTTETYDYYGKTNENDGGRVLVAADFGKLIDCAFDAPLSLVPGQYLITAAMFNNNEVPIAFSGFSPAGQTAGWNGTSNVGLIGNSAYDNLVEAPVVRIEFEQLASISEFTSVTEVNVFPNPFVGTTEMKFNLKSDSKVSVVITDVTGRTVATVPATQMNAGEQTISIDGTNFVAGIYNYTLKVGNETITKRIVKK